MEELGDQSKVVFATLLRESAGKYVEGGGEVNINPPTPHHTTFLHTYLMAELGDQCKVVFAKFVTDTIYIEG